jgi:hypothetical protein
MTSPTKKPLKPLRRPRRPEPKKLGEDETPWIAVAQEVLKGQHLKRGRSHLESVHIGLRRVNHPDCRKAKELIEQQKDFKPA